MAFPGVKIGGYHCWSSWSCYLASRKIGTPEVREHKVEIPGRDGYLDLTEYLTGDAKLGNREIEIKLLYKAEPKFWPAKLRQIRNLVHGKTLEIIFDDDSSYGYTGRCIVEEERNDDHSVFIVITVDADPYAHGVSAEASYSFTSIGSSAITYYTKSVTAGSIYIPVAKSTSGFRYTIYIEIDGVEHVFMHDPNLVTEFNFNGFILKPESSNQIKIGVKSNDSHATISTFITLREATL